MQNMPAGAKSYSLNWIVGKYPPIVGVHPGDKVVFAYDSAHNVFKLSDQKVCTLSTRTFARLEFIYLVCK